MYTMRVPRRSDEEMDWDPNMHPISHASVSDSHRRPLLSSDARLQRERERERELGVDWSEGRQSDRFFGAGVAGVVPPPRHRIQFEHDDLPLRRRVRSSREVEIRREELRDELLREAEVLALQRIDDDDDGCVSRCLFALSADSHG